MRINISPGQGLQLLGHIAFQQHQAINLEYFFGERPTFCLNTLQNLYSSQKPTETAISEDFKLPFTRSRVEQIEDNVKIIDKLDFAEDELSAIERVLKG